TAPHRVVSGFEIVAVYWRDGRAPCPLCASEPRQARGLAVHARPARTVLAYREWPDTRGLRNEPHLRPPTVSPHGRGTERMKSAVQHRGRLTGLATALGLAAMMVAAAERGSAQPPAGLPAPPGGPEPAKAGVSVNDAKAYRGYTLVAPMTSTKTY